jgi:hypothetical protein
MTGSLRHGDNVPYFVSIISGKINSIVDGTNKTSTIVPNANE